MNWKKLLLAVGVTLFVLTTLAVIALGTAVTAGVAVAGEAIRMVGEGVEVDVPESGRFDVRSEDGARFSFEADERELVVTDADGDRVRVFVPRAIPRLERFDFDGPDPIILWPAIVLAPLVALGKGLTFLAAVGLILVGVWLVLRYRRQPLEKAPST